MSARARSPATVVFVDQDGAETVVGRLGAGCADLPLVDALAQLQLAARRRGHRMRLRDATDDLRGLLDLVGLGDALGVEARREPEVGEVLGPDEVMEPGDPPV